jgi:hypothetical protein
MQVRIPPGHSAIRRPDLCSEVRTRCPIGSSRTPTVDLQDGAPGIAAERLEPSQHSPRTAHVPGVGRPADARRGLRCGWAFERHDHQRVSACSGGGGLDGSIVRLITREFAPLRSMSLSCMCGKRNRPRACSYPSTRHARTYRVPRYHSVRPSPLEGFTCLLCRR